MKKRQHLIIVAVVLVVVSLFYYVYPQLTRPQAPTGFEDVVITLSRDNYEAGLRYNLTIYDNGSVVYDGFEFSADFARNAPGTRTTSISAEDVRELVDAFYDIDYFSLKDRYPERGADFTRVSISLTVGGETKSTIIFADYLISISGDEKKLYDLANKIDAVTNSSQWMINR